MKKKKMKLLILFITYASCATLAITPYHNSELNCTYACDNPQCPLEVRTVCEETDCVIQCPANNTACFIDTPSCAITCPTDQVITDSCPMCEIICDPLPAPDCTGCNVMCSAVSCNWQVRPPPVCPQPTCVLQCPSPACEAISSASTLTTSAALLLLLFVVL